MFKWSCDTVASKLFIHKGIFKIINDRLPVGDIFSYK